jgi:hypothetical protein
MRKFFGIILFLLSFNKYSAGQQDKELMDRLDSVLKVTQSKEFEKILDYTYPKLFTIITREQMVQELRSAFESEEFSVAIDSLKIKKIFPVFTTTDGQFTKIIHTMIMKMKFKEVIDSSLVEPMIQQMEQGFGSGNVRFDNATNSFIAKMVAEMIAIKDEFAKNWCFVNNDEENNLADLLFSKEVNEKLHTYK